jgi:septal ring factor EnvC (AmiA/AmiB activator)
MAVPATGALVARFGDPMPAGAPASKGLTFETRPGAQVVAPFDGKVLFAGPFKGYGQILIIGHGDGYHSLLAGLDRVDESVGQWLVAGEPVGVMSQSSQKPRLYLELRHDGQPINPLPWLAIRDEKVNG